MVRTLDSNQANKILYQLDCVRFIEDIISPSCTPPMQLKEFHKEWIDLINNNRFVSLLAPRSHGKTTLLGAYIIWKIVTNPKIRILVVTINQEMADRIMSFIQRHIEGNTDLINIFGVPSSTGNLSLRGYSDWTRSKLRVLGAGNQKDPTLSVIGITASMVGGHYDMIILDDIMDAGNSRTEHGRNEVFSLYNSTMMPMLEPPNGKLVSIATKWHDNDISWYLQRKPDFASKIYRAIIKYPEKNNGVAEVLWEDKFPYEELIKIKERDGSLSFEMQYQNNIVSLADSPIKGDWVDMAIADYKVPEPEYEVYMGVDFASKGEESDYFVIVIVAVKDAKVYVIDALRTKASLFRQFELIRSYDTKWQPIRIGIEQAAQQKIIVDQLIESTTLPIIPIKSSIVNDRMSRIQRLSVLFETGRIFMNSENEAVRILSDEAKIFPHGANDDLLDGLSFAIQASQYMEEDTHIDWNLIPDMISTRKNEETVNSVKRNNYEFYKI
ncbi:MAG: hypothetical protein IMZ52_02855 [Actinobacteria bacterium]|nr:hypothetical protein [Actinomycetota bacterium]MBE3114885.1 hypothetical protein [Actinomycetota bacterium]